MRAVRLPPPGGRAELVYRKRRRGIVASESGRSERSSRRVVGGLRAGCLASGNAAVATSRSRFRAGALRVALAASSSRPSRRGKPPRVEAWPADVLANESWAVVSPLIQSSSWPMALPLGVRTSRQPCVLAGAVGERGVRRRAVYQSRWFWPGRRRKAKPNERMQLTWLIGAPIHAGLGSPASRRAMRSRFTRHAADAGR